MKLGETFYAAVSSDGHILTPRDGTSNGLHDKPGKAEAYLKKQQRQYRSYVSSINDGIAKGVTYRPEQLVWHKASEDVLNRLEDSKVVEVKVVLA